LSLLENGTASIELGVEDYKLATINANRAVSAARNIYAGILLLLKHCLAEVSESLVFQRLKPDLSTGTLEWVPDGKKTVDFIQIRERWKQLGWGFDFALLEKIQRERNAIEHWHSETPTESLRELLADSFQLIVAIFRDHLESTPAAHLAPDAWETIAQEAKIQAELAEACRASRKAVQAVPEPLEDFWEDEVQCLECGSELLRVDSGTQFPDIIIVCDRCGENNDVVDVIEVCVGAAYPDPPRAWRDGGQSVDKCPNCDVNAYVLELDVCLFCGETRPYDRCAMCGATMELDEQDGEFCSYCSNLGWRD